VFLERDKPWFAERMPLVEDQIRNRLTELEVRLGHKDWLDGDFTAGDLVMIQALRRLNGSDLLTNHPKLSDYVARGEARPAFRRAFAAQLAVFAGKHTEASRIDA
jgi:glutathione S-transferase